MADPCRHQKLVPQAWAALLALLPGVIYLAFSIKGSTFAPCTEPSYGLAVSPVGWLAGAAIAYLAKTSLHIFGVIGGLKRTANQHCFGLVQLAGYMWSVPNIIVTALIVFRETNLDCVGTDVYECLLAVFLFLCLHNGPAAPED